MLSAPYHRRLAACLIDIALGGLPFWLVSPLALVLILSGSSQGNFIGRFLLLAAAPLGLFTFMMIGTVQIWRGRPTPGRYLLKLDLLAGAGARVGPFRTLARQSALLATVLAAIIVRTPELLLIAPCFSLIDRRGRNLFDALCGTVIVNARPKPAFGAQASD